MGFLYNEWETKFLNIFFLDFSKLFKMFQMYRKF